MKRLYIFLFIVFLYSSLLGQSSLYLKTPYDEAVFSADTDSIHFLWNATAAASYDLEIAATPTFSSIQSYNTTATSYTVAIIDLTDTTYWRVVDSNGATSAERMLSIHDLASLGTLTYRIDASENITLDNNRVTTWENSVSSNYTATQGVDNLRPTHQNNVLNGKDVVHFGGTIGTDQHRLSLPSLTIENLNFTLFTVYKQQSVNTELPYILGFTNGTRSAGVHAQGTFGTFNNFGIAYTNPLVQRRPNFAGDFTWATRSFVNNLIYFNGSEVSGYTGSGVDGFRMNMIGSRPDVTSLNFHGDLAEVIVYSNQLTTTDRELVDEYLITKYHAYPDLGDDMDTCTFQVTLGPIDDPAFNTVNWSTGETNVASITVNQNGWYWVETEAFDRIVRDSIFVEGLVPKPILSQVNDTTICLFDTLDISYLNTLPSGITSEWHDGSTTILFEAYQTDTIYDLFSNSNGCTISSDTLLFNINQFPATEGLGLDRTVCLNTELFFAYGTSSSGSYTHLWGDGSTNPSFEPTVLGIQDYTIEVTDGMGCIAYDTVQIELANSNGPLVDFTFDTVCPYASHQFTDQSVPSSGDAISSYEWHLPEDTLFGSSISYAHSDTTSYVVELKISTDAGCSNIKRDTATFLPKPYLSFATSGICEEQQISFNGGQLTPTTINTWEWSFDDPTSGLDNVDSGQNTTHIFDSAGDYDVELIGTDVKGCKDTLQQTKTILPSPTVDFNFTEVCKGNVVGFENASSILSPATLSTYQWDFGDGTNSGQTDPQKPYSAHGNYAVSLTATGDNGCSNDTTKEIKIHAFPQVDNVISQTCAGVGTQFSDESFIPNGSVAAVEWSVDNQPFIDGFSVEYLFQNSGDYNLDQSVTSSFGCVNSKTSSITINDYLSAGFEVEPSAFIAGVPINFHNTSIGGTGLDWSFGTFATSQQPDTTIIFDTGQIGQDVPVQLIVKNDYDCADTVAITLPVLERETDLEVSQLFTQEDNGFLTVGVGIKNNGSTPLSEVDLIVRQSSSGILKETWTGMLQAGEEEVYLLAVSPSANKPENNPPQDYLCIEGRIVTPTQFSEIDFSNNEVCKSFSDNQVVAILPYPNPVNEQLTIQVVMPKSAVGTIKIYDEQGRLVHIVAEEKKLQKGLNNFSVNTAGWAAGNYKIRTERSRSAESNDNSVLTIGFIKL